VRVPHSSPSNVRKRPRDNPGEGWGTDSFGYRIPPCPVDFADMTSMVTPISRVLQTLKQYVGRHGKQALRHIWSRSRTLGSRPMDIWARATGPKPFWKTRAHDFNVTTEQSLHVKLDYMHKNPITRGLVDRAEQWQWSSYCFYELDDDSVIAMDWDGSWPIT